MTQSYLAEHFGLDSSDLPEDVYPLRYKIIEKYQAIDKELICKSKKNKEYKSTVFHGGGKQYKLLTKHGKVVMPAQLQQRAVNWLCHPGRVRTEESIRQHFTFHRLSSMEEATIKTCPTCQKTKRSYKKYRHLPEKWQSHNPGRRYV